MMIKFVRLALVFVLFCPPIAHAQKSKNTSSAENKPAEPQKLIWHEWNNGYELAKQTGKIALVDAYTDWCGWCKRMDRDTYSNPDVVALLNTYFVPIKFNPEIENVAYYVETDTVSGPQLYGMLSQGKSTGYPTTYYLFPRKMRIIIDPGYKGPDDFIKILKSAIEENKK